MTDLVVIVGVMALLAALILSGLAGAKAKSRRISCNCNLKQVGLSFRVFATDHSDAFPMNLSTNKGGSKEFTNAVELFRHFQSMSNALSTPKVLVCPADTRKLAASFTNLSNLNVSYFVSLDCNETMPQTLLAGDRNLTMNGVHGQAGIIDADHELGAGLVGDDAQPLRQCGPGRWQCSAPHDWSPGASGFRDGCRDEPAFDSLNT
jgi:hypothetical protein